jgi:peptide-methionine (S)-S-oxide reductase
VRRERIVFCGGCFWCTEAIFQRLDGVISVTPGYAGGDVPNPTYEQVCTGTTGHAECVEVVYDPDRLSLDDQLAVFFATHDPTTPNRQGNDVGPQYRSMILYTTDEQARLARQWIEKLNREFAGSKQVVTELRMLESFYPAEEYHRNYYRRNPDAAYCEFVIEPKLVKLRKLFPSLLRE